MRSTTNNFIIAVFAIGLQSCYYDNEQYLYPESTDIGICQDTSFTYNSRISGLISGNCFGPTCHNQVKNGRVNLTTFNAVSSNGVEIVCRVVEGDLCSQGNKMPPTGNLSACDKEAFTRWQQNGYQE
jgi:hypothetical protein